MKVSSYLIPCALLVSVALGISRSDGTASGQASSSVELDPAALGFSVPSPEPALPPDADAFHPMSYKVSSKAPAIAEISRNADRGDVISMTGVNLTRPSQIEIFSQGRDAPKGSVRSVEPLLADGTAATMLIPEDLPPWSMYLVWPARNGLQGRAMAINRTEAWWIGPDKAEAGALVSVYGRNLSRSGGTGQSHIYIKPTGKPGWYVTPASVNPFRVSFQVPDLPPASYEIWMHNGHGGRFGWSGPLSLEVLAHSPWAGRDAKVLDVKSFGATGNGMADDTSAVMQALHAATASAPATVFFPAGTYVITAPLHSPGGVTWLGEGRDMTTLRLGHPIGQSMIISPDNDVQFRKMTLMGDRKTGLAPLLNLSSAKNVRLDDVRLDAWGAPALDAQAVSGLFIENSELIENGSFYGSSRQVFLTGNKFRMTGYGESVVALWGGRDFAMVGNELADADQSREDGHGIGRFFVGQSHFGSMRNLYWEKNVSRSAAPHDCGKVDCNKGEQICFEIVGSQLKNDFVAASEDAVVFRSAAGFLKPVSGGLDLVIVGGRGAGQQRHIVSTNGTTAKLEAKWNVIPDKTSRFALAAIASRAAIYDNTFEGRDSYNRHDSDSTGVLLYGNVYDVVVDSNRISRMRHGMMTVALESASGLSPYFLQYSNNRVSDSNSGLYVGTTFADAGVEGIWGGLGNIYRKNVFSNIDYIGVEYETWDNNGADYNGTVFDRNSFDNLRYGFVDAYHLMWTYDGAFKAGPPSRSRRFNTVLYRNRFNRGNASFDGSKGFVTVHPENTWLDLGSTWSGFSSGNTGPR
ncbi:glycoside hydrolase family 28 protein [Neorhizobium lilium]|uniref:Glycoside hydrolase family 28 protein n=1 Tax=Neorhizobium lilium TaxID=2503024 RepID=A0A3S4UU47_9HYPH|nr:glycosyl hydrolase family 28-related protein [Neorhizobium lilium]RWX80913.1 glycoside hydrolase family 28 protein [Neorhizobium lilium]